MSSNGAGYVSGDGFNPASMMAGMNQPEKAGLTPPIPNVAYRVAVNSQAAGPFDLTVLKLMIATGHFTANSLVWKQGMTLLEAAKKCS